MNWNNHMQGKQEKKHSKVTQPNNPKLQVISKWQQRKMAPFQDEDPKPMGLRRHKYQRGTAGPKLLTNYKHLQGWKYKWHYDLGDLMSIGIVTPSAPTSMNVDGHDFHVRTENSSICTQAQLSFPTFFFSELAIVFLFSCPKDLLDKVIEINSWKMIPTSTHPAVVCSNHR